MRRALPGLFALTLALGIGAEFTGVQISYAQQTSDPRIADLVQAGVLRVGIGLGTPMQAIKNPATGEVRGVALELGRALSARMGLNFVAVEYPRPGAVLEGVRTNAWDVAFLVMDPARAEQIEFSQPYMQTDFTYMVSAGSAIYSVADADQPGVRIIVPRGDGSDLYLTRVLKRAELVRTDTHAAALELLRTRGANAFASARPVLMAASPEVPGSRVLDDGFAAISFAALVPKGQAARLAYVDEFIADAKASGLIKRLIESIGLQGIQVAPAGNPRTQ